ncbi:MAG: suppressor of fused domain protein [Labilithrix sp.]|nr:suppressor of fused domain protein [Labilithrix sp.]MBX3224781.1 suppressor of fused domain protein [Labilithrix sp.]
MFDADGESALVQALLAAHPDAEPLRFDASPPPRKIEIAGCLAARVEEPIPHWVVVSRGFTELGDKLEEDPEVSGWGFELTCRVPARVDEPDVGWVVDWMQRVADDLAARVSFLEPYHHMAIQPTTTDDEIAAVVFVEDGGLAPTRSQNGAFYFLQMVGLTRGEYEALHAWDPRALVDLVRERDPLLLLDTDRATFLRDPGFARAVDEGRDRDGSSIGVRHGVAVLWTVDDDELQLHLDVDAAAVVRSAVEARLRHGKTMALFGDRRKTLRADGSLALRSQVNVALRPEDGPSEIVIDDDGGRTCVIRLGPDALAELTTVLQEAPGAYVLPSLPSVRFVVVTRERMGEPGYPR